MITLYSTHCPKCRVIEMKLAQKNIDYTLVDDIDAIIKIGEICGFRTAPILEVDGQYLDFAGAVKFINER